MWMGKGGEKASISLVVSHLIVVSSPASTLPAADHLHGPFNKRRLPQSYMYASHKACIVEILSTSLSPACLSCLSFSWLLSEQAFCMVLLVIVVVI